MGGILNHTQLAAKLVRSRANYGAVGALRQCAPPLIEDLLAILFPHFSRTPPRSEAEIESYLANVETELEQVVGTLRTASYVLGTDIPQRFTTQLEAIHDLLLLDAEAIHRGDPAAKSVDEIILCYPGFYAIAVYRIAHALLALGVPLFPRVLTEYAHKETGIDIHPGAQIGSSFCIDHGSGIVIGETTIIKDNVRMYQGVTLGGLVITKGHANQKRHPTIESNVVIYANATILGGETVVGAGSVIGGNVWLTASVEPSSLVYHKGDITVRAASKNPE